MRISKTWLRPIVTAVLFPIVLTNSMWALDEFTGDEWLPWTHEKISSRQAIEIAKRNCFAREGLMELAPWHTKLRNGQWLVSGQDNGRYWTLQARSHAGVYASVDAESGKLIECSGFVE